MSRERKRKRDERTWVEFTTRELPVPGGGFAIIDGVKLDIVKWQGVGTRVEFDPVTGLDIPVANFVAGSHRPTIETPIPSDRN